MKQYIKIRQKFLLVPIKVTAMRQSLEMFLDGKMVYECSAGLFTKECKGEPDFYAEIPVDASWMGKTLEIVTDGDTQTEFAQSDTLLPDPNLLKPYIHGTPKTGWANDVCGLCWYQGRYHVYFQHNMFGVEWANMSWGHLVSEDLLHWEFAPEALLPTDEGAPFTGSAVIAQDVPGIPDGSLMMYFTAAGGFTKWSEGKKFYQRIAWSEDGYTFGYYPGGLPNVVFENRDPKIGIYDDGRDRHWYMVLFMDGHDYSIFTSRDLRSWEMTQTLRIPQTWEVPDLVELAVEGSEEKKWLFWSPNGFYLVGDFDGKQFTACQDGKLFYGNHVMPYAASTFANVKDRVIQMPYLHGHTESCFLHTSMFGLPREMSLVKRDEQYYLAEHPVRELLDRTHVVWEKTLDYESMSYSWDENQAVLIRLRIRDNESFDAKICGQRICWDKISQKLAFSFVNNDETTRISDMTILTDRGVMEITINNDTVIYYNKSAMEIVKNLTVRGAMDVTFALIDA